MFVLLTSDIAFMHEFIYLQLRLCRNELRQSRKEITILNNDLVRATTKLQNINGARDRVARRLHEIAKENIREKV